MQPVTVAQLADAIATINLAAYLGAFGAGLLGAGFANVIREVYAYHWAIRRARRIRRIRMRQVQA